MKALKLFTLLGLSILLLTSCGSSLQLARSSEGDDIYYNPQDSKVQVAVNGSHVELDSQTKQLIAETNRAVGDTIYVETDSTGNPYQDVLADSYEKAMQNRALGQQDPWNGISSNTYTNQSFWYAQAYDPAFYNIIVMGNTVWAEPKYISAMFGYPYSSPYINYGAYYSPWNNYWNYSYGWTTFGYYDSWWRMPFGYMPWYAGSGWPWGGNYYYNNFWDYPYWCGGGGGHLYPSHYTGRDVVYGPRGLNSRSDRYNSVGYSTRRGSASTVYNRGNVISASRGSSTIRREPVVNNNINNSRPTVNAARPTSAATTRPSSSGYTPSYSRPVRNSDAVFNAGNGNTGVSPARPSAVSPRISGSSYNSGSNSNRNNSYTPTPTRVESTSTYTPSQSYSSPSTGSSSGTSSGSPSRGRR